MPREDCTCTCDGSSRGFFTIAKLLLQSHILSLQLHNQFISTLNSCKQLTSRPSQHQQLICVTVPFRNLQHRISYPPWVTHFLTPGLHCKSGTSPLYLG